MTPPFLEARGIEKRFGGVHALRGVDLRLEAGEVLALVGENGAGKSTLMRVIAGVERADAGALSVRGEPVAFQSVQDGLRHGVALIHQELQLADNLDVAENVFLGDEPRRGPFRDVAAMRERAAILLARLGSTIPATTRVGDLPIGQRQLVEIAKALAREASVLVMDEPTSSLSTRETQNLFAVVRELKAAGKAILYVSHRLAEVEEIADRVEVLRDGRNAGALRREEIGHEAMVRLMVGRDLARRPERAFVPAADALLEVEGLRTRAHPAHAVSFAVRRGEIVALAGLVGSGRSELLEAIFGSAPALEGKVRVAGRPFDPRLGPREAARRGLALVPEDRKRQGLLLELAVGENLVLPSLARLANRGWRAHARERDLCATSMRGVAVKASGPAQCAAELSGGNQQKVVLGKWLAREPAVLLLDEPTRGVDVGAKDEIHGLVERVAADGKAVLLASSDMEEVLALADRVLVLRDGRLAGELSRTEASEVAVMRLATEAADATGPAAERAP